MIIQLYQPCSGTSSAWWNSGAYRVVCLVINLGDYVVTWIELELITCNMCVLTPIQSHQLFSDDIKLVPCLRDKHVLFLLLLLYTLPGQFTCYPIQSSTKIPLFSNVASLMFLQRIALTSTWILSHSLLYLPSYSPKILINIILLY